MIRAPEISLPCFEGPLDLLLSLVRKNDLDVTDLPIAEITRQYLEYLRAAAEMDLDLGSEFIYMAAVLIHIKTRCLLKPDPEIAGGVEDPRQELVRQLLDRDQVRWGAEFLRDRLELAGASWSHCEPPELRADLEENQAPNGSLNLLQVLRLAQQALAAARTHELVALTDPVPVEEMVRWLNVRLAAVPDSIEAQHLLTEQPDAPHRVSLFLAMLDLANSARISLRQEAAFGPIAITAQVCRNV